MADNSAGNLDIQQSINDAIAARAGLLSKQTEMMKGQVLIAMELCKALKCEELEGMADRVQGVSTALAGAQQQAAAAGQSLLGAAAAAGKLTNATQKSGETAASQGNAYQALGDTIGEAFANAGAQLDAMTALLGSVTTGIYGIASALISIPLTVFSVIMESASELANSTSALAQAMEEVRKAFGDLSKAEGAQVIGTFEQMDAQSSNLAGTGLSLSKVFGSGPEGLAAAMNAVAETASAMGPVFGVLSDEFATAGAEIMMLQKGLGLTGEAMKGIGSYALSMGESMEDTLMQNANLALQLGEKFGVSSKLIAQDLGYMQSNMGKFGSITKTQMTAAATYTRKLGMEIKDLEGLLGAFDDFETAATSASKLAQAFGMNVDAMQMMQEQDPAKRLDMLRQSFAATGKSIENMSRQEKALLAQSAGLDENTVSLALSTENMGLSYDEVMAGAEAAADSQKSEAEIMLDVAENIERVIENLNETTSSFFDTFINGFMKGITQTEEFKEMQRALADALAATFKFGVEVGKMFVDLFPGIKDMMSGLTALFDPVRFGALIKDLTGIFRTFFTDLSTDPVKAVEKFMSAIQEKFFNFFNPKEGGGAEFIAGLKKFGAAIVGGLAGLGGYLIKAVAGAVKDLAAYIRGDGLSETGDSVMKGLSALIDPFYDVLMKTAPILLDALKDLFMTVMKKFGPQIAVVIGTVLTANFAVGFARSIAGGLTSAVKDVMKDKLKSIISKLVMPSIPAPKDSPSGAVDSAGGVVESLNKLKVSDIAKAMAIGLALVALVSVAIVAFAIAVDMAADVMSGTSVEDIVKVFTSTAMGVGATIGLVASAKLLDKGDMMKAGVAMLGAAALTSVAIVAYAYAVQYAAGVLSNTPWDDIIKVFAATGMGLVATGVLAVTAMMLIMDGGTSLVLGGLAMIAAAAFASVSIVAFAYAVRFAVGALGSISFLEVAKTFAAVGIGILATGALAALSAGVGAILATTGPVAIVGFLAAAKLLEEGVPYFGEALATAMANFPQIDHMIVMKNLALVGVAIVAAGALAAVGMAAGMIGPGLVVAALGMIALAEFFKSAIGSVVTVLEGIMAINIGPDPSKLKDKMDIVAAVVSALGSFVGIALDAGAMGVMSGLFGGPDLSETLKSLSGFLADVGASLVGIVTSLSSMALGWSEEDMKKMASMGQLLASIGSLAGALVGPLETLAGIKGEWFGDSATEKVASVTEGLTKIMDKIKEKLPELVSAVATIPLGGLTPEKAEMLSSLMDGISKVSKVVIDSVKLASENPELFAQMPATMDKIFTGLNGALGSVSRNMPDFTKYSTELETYKEAALAPTVEAILNDIRAVNDALASIGEVEIAATIGKLGDSLSLKNEVLKIENKPIEMHVTLNLTMKAEDIAKEIFDVTAKMVKDPNKASDGQKEIAGVK